MSPELLIFPNSIFQNQVFILSSSKFSGGSISAEKAQDNPNVL